jgi:DNA-binding CsgD family transcriptional regulator
VTAIAFTISALSREKVLYLQRLFFFQLAFLFTIVTIALKELNQGRIQIYDDLTKIAGLLGVCLIIITLPRFINSRKSLMLFKHADRGFLIAGSLLFIHYTASSAVYFSVYYNQDIAYFHGHRVLPVFASFLILALAHFYTAVSFITAGKGLHPKERRVLRIFGLASFIIIPAMVIIDNLRWLFLFLWRIYPFDRQFILPGFFIYLNITIILAIEANRITISEGTLIALENDNLGLSSREQEVAELLINGCSYRCIGERLNISLSTVQSHIVKIYQKADVNDKVGLIKVFSSQRRQ